MSTNLILVRKYYEAFNSKDFKSMLSFLSEDVIHELNQGETQKGRDSFIKFMDHMNNCYDEKLEDLTYFEGPNGRIATEFYVQGTYLKTDSSLPPAHGQKYRIRAGAFLEVEGDKITRVTTYYNLPNWIAAVKAL